MSSVFAGGVGRADLAAEADRVGPDPAPDDGVEPGEGPTADEQHVGGVDLQELLVGVLAAPLRRHRGHRALEDLEQRLLHTLAGHVTGDRRVLRLAGDLVDLVDVDDPGLGPLDVEVGRLDELEQDVLDVLAHVTGLGEGGGVGDGEGHVEQTGQGLCHQRLAHPGGADEEDVRLLQLDVVVVVAGADPLVVVVHRHRQDPLGALLADDVVVEERVDLVRLGELGEGGGRGLRQLLLDDLVAQLDALVADVDPGTGDELLDLLLRLPAERALQELGSFVFRHRVFLLSPSSRLRGRGTG